MATVNNAVAAVSDQAQISGTSVLLSVNVQTDTGKAFSITVAAPISDTAGQLDNAIFSAVQSSVTLFGDTMPSNASLMVLGGKT